MEFIGEGLTNWQVAERMFLARQDCHEMSYVSALLGRLGMRRRTLVAALADRQTPPPTVRTARTGS
jgi:two-component system, NarL family, response regulator DevR